MKLCTLVAIGLLVRIPDALAQAPINPPMQLTSPMQVRLTINGQHITATLDDNASARDFASLLPLTLKLKDHAATEKIADLPRKLSTQGAPAGVDPAVGDIAYYAPWGNLALFYRDFSYSTGLIRLGRLNGGASLLASDSPLTLTIERLSPPARPAAPPKP